MRLVALPIGAALLAACALVVLAPARAGRDSRLAAVHSWAFAIGDGDLAGDLNARYAGFGLVVVDGEGASAAQIATLRARGTVVLGYLDVGTIESGRSWFASTKPYRLDFWRDWGEWYANVAAPGFRQLIAERVAPAMLAKGLDGLFLDNADMTDTHPAQTRGMKGLVGALAQLVHRQHRFLFAQNGDAVIGPLLPFLDGWNREDVSRTYDFASRRYVAVRRPDTAAATATLRRLRALGLLTLATDYVERGNSAATRAAIAAACATGALPFVSDIGLTRIPRPPQHC